MRIGTKSLLYGAHQFLLHPLFVWRAWIKLYGWSWDLRLWLSFFVHDLGYWGKPNMDGPEGESHVELGRAIMSLFSENWGEFCYAHSRFHCVTQNIPISRLCVADKLAITLVPRPLYLLMVRATGEIREYRGIQKHVDDLGSQSGWSDEEWFDTLRSHMLLFVEEWRAPAQVNDLLLLRGPHGKT